MAKENTGPRSRYGKCLIKALARSWQSNLSPDGVSRELGSLYEDFQTSFEDTPKKATEFYQRTVEGLLDHLQHDALPAQVVEWRLLSKNLVNPGSANEPVPEEAESEENLDWMDDDVSMGELFDSPAPVEASELLKELIDYVGKVQGVWDYMKPFYFRRSTVNKSTLFVVTSVGTSKKTNVKTNVNVAVGAVKLPDIGEDYLYFEDGHPVKYGYDADDGRTYWGWAFKIVNGDTLRFWMSRVTGYTRQGDEVWEQRAKVLIKLNSKIPRGYQLLSAKHEDRS